MVVVLQKKKGADSAAKKFTCVSAYTASAKIQVAFFSGSGGDFFSASLQEGTHNSIPSEALSYIPTVDGRNPKQPPGMYKNPVNHGITYLSLNW